MQIVPPHLRQTQRPGKLKNSGAPNVHGHVLNPSAREHSVLKSQSVTSQELSFLDKMLGISQNPAKGVVGRNHSAISDGQGSFQQPAPKPAILSQKVNVLGV